MSQFDFVNINGEAWKPSADSIKTKAKPKREAPEEWHRGWTVEGFEPGHLAQAKRYADEACASWNSLGEEQKAQKLREGVRAPKPWDQDAYVQRTKRKKVRGKPYEAEESARQCAQMAERAGWQFVVVVEQKKTKEA